MSTINRVFVLTVGMLLTTAVATGCVRAPNTNPQVSKPFVPTAPAPVPENQPATPTNTNKSAMTPDSNQDGFDHYCKIGKETYHYVLNKATRMYEVLATDKN